MYRAEYKWGDKIRNDEMGGSCATYGAGEKCVRVFLVAKREGKSPFGRHKRRWHYVKIVLC
jgi:hypothetical protein